MKYKIEFEHTLQDYKDILIIESKYFHPSTIVSLEQCIIWNKKNSDAQLFIRDLQKDKVIAELVILPLSELQFNKFMLNELKDYDLNYDTLLKFEENNSYYLLLSAITIDPDYRDDREVLSLLLSGFNDKLDSLIARNIEFINICAEGQTEDGQKFIEDFLNLQYKCNTKEGYKLYAFNEKKDFDIWKNNFPKYIENYNKKFKINYKKKNI